MVPGPGHQRCASSFDTEFAARITRSGVPAGLAAAALTVGGNVVDRVLEPAQAGPFLVARLVCGVVVLVLTILLARPHPVAVSGLLVLAMVVAVDALSAWMLPRAPHAGLAYVLAMCLTMAAVALVIDWPWIYAIPTAGAALIAVVVADALAPARLPLDELTTAAALLTATGVIVVVGQYAKWHTSRGEYDARVRAESARAAAEADRDTNAALVATLQTMVRQDPLTGLANRRALAEDLTAAVRLARRQQHSLGLVLLDIDNFKQINDRYGHPAGDHVLRAIGDVLRHRLRASDHAARYGGEEFVLVLPDIHAADALALVEALRQQISESVDLPSTAPGGPAARVTVSAGIALYPEHADTADDLLVAADRAMYAAKAAGRNTSRLARAPD